MKIKFLATGNAPDLYRFEGEVIKSFYGGKNNAFDLSVLRDGDEFLGIKSDLDLLPPLIIRNARRVDGTLYVTLCQKSPKGDWRDAGEWINADEYDPNKMYIKEVDSDGQSDY